MRRPGICILSLFFVSATVFSKDFRPDWDAYTTSEYVYSIQHGFNRDKRDESSFLNSLAGDARSDLARQFETRIKDTATIDRKSVDGRTSLVFNSVTEFLTDDTLRLCEVRTCYSKRKKEGYAIAYINKARAGAYYRNEFEMALENVRGALSEAGILIEEGRKFKARDAVLTPALAMFDLADRAVARLIFFDVSKQELASLVGRRNECEREVRRLIHDLENSVAVYLHLTADMFGKDYPLDRDICAALSDLGCRFVGEEPQADWIVEGSGRAVKFAEMPFTSYSGEPRRMYAVGAYMDLTVRKFKTGDVIYEGRVNSPEKGRNSDMLKAAEQAYSLLVPGIMTILEEELSK